MTVRLVGDIIRLEADCYVEDAEILVRMIQDGEGRTVDLSACRHLHSAVAQVLLSFGTTIAVGPEDDFLREHLMPSLEQSSLARKTS